MIENKKTLYFVLTPIIFVLGVGGGYLLGANKSADKVVYVDNGKPCSSKPAAISSGKTEIGAKEAFNVALGEAGGWAEDSYLSEINLASKKFSAGGLSGGWKITFYSKKKNKFYDITIKDGESRGGEERAAEKISQTLKGEMVDSSVLAKSFFAAYPADTEITSLKMYYDPGAKKFLWTIFFPKGSHTIDAEL